MREEKRRQEIEALEPILAGVEKSKTIYPPEGVYEPLCCCRTRHC